jgi:hypothetical protein
MLNPTFIGQAGKAWRSAAVDLQRIENLRSASELARNYANPGELAQDIRQDSQGLSL